MKIMQPALYSGIALLASCAITLAQAPPAGGQAGPPPPRPNLSVTSSAWPDGGEVPMKYSGRGDNKGPAFEFHWNLGPNSIPAPDSLQTYAVIFHDVENSTNKTTADTLHWTAFNIPGTAKGLPEGLGTGDLPDGTRNGPGIAARRGTPGYFGPGAGPGPIHHYVFEFYALDTKLDLPASTTREDLLKAMDGHVIGKAAYFGRFHMTAPAP
jgi:Raf kinase inhibitor-like YbhB/YbcL family protein